MFKNESMVLNVCMHLHKYIYIKQLNSYVSAFLKCSELHFKNIFMNLFCIYRLHPDFQPLSNKLEPFMTHVVSCFAVQYQQVFRLFFSEKTFHPQLLCSSSLAKYKIKVLILTKNIHLVEEKPNVI